MQEQKNKKPSKQELEELEDYFAERLAHIFVEQVLDEERQKNSE